MFQRNPNNSKQTQYHTGGNYPAQENTAQASVPESESLMPSAKRMTIEDYFAMMAQSYGQIAQATSVIQKSVEQAADRNHLVRITGFGTDAAIPNTDYWRTCYVSRPSMAESLFTTGLTPKDITLYFDDDFAVIIPYYGQIVIPNFGYNMVRAVNAGPGGAGVYPATWALDLMFTSRQYNPTQWAVSA